MGRPKTPPPRPEQRLTGEPINTDEMDQFSAGFYEGQTHAIRTCLQLFHLAFNDSVALAFLVAAKGLAAELGMSVEEVKAVAPETAP